MSTYIIVAHGLSGAGRPGDETAFASVLLRDCSRDHRADIIAYCRRHDGLGAPDEKP
jgi:hypothetical protein